MSDDEIKRTNRLPRHITLSQLDEINKTRKSWFKPYPHLKLLAAPDLLASGTAAVFFLSSASSVVLRALPWHVGLWLRLRYSNWKIAIDSICISGLNKSGTKLEKAEPLKFLSMVVINAPLSK